jgi:hypothetical protein
VAVQPFSLPLDSLFSSFTAPPAPLAAAEQPSSRRLSGVGRTVIAIAATSVFFGGAGSLYMHAAMGHMSPGSMMGNSASMQQPADTAGLAAPAPAMPVTTGSDAAPPRALGDGMPMPATAAAAPMAAAPMAAAPQASTPAKQPSPATSHASSASSSASSSSTSSTVRRYAIGEGDSFSTFAARYGVSEARIAALNPGVDSTSLTIGQSLPVR